MVGAPLYVWSRHGVPAQDPIVESSDSAAVVSPPPQRHRLGLGMVWILVSNGVYALSQWLVIILVARLVDAEAVGQYGLALAVTAPIMLLGTLRMRSAIVTDMKGQFRLSTYLRVGLSTSLAALLAVCLLTAVIARDLSAALTIVLVGGAKAADNVSELFYGVLQRDERLGGIAALVTLNGTLTLVVAWLGLRLSPLALTVAAGSAGSSALVAVASAALAAPSGAGTPYQRLRPTLRAFVLRCAGPKVAMKQPSWSLVKTVLPLTAVTVLASLSVNLPRYFVDAQLGEAALGVYTALSYLAIVGSLAINAVGQAVTPRLARYHASGAGGAFMHLLRQAVVAGTAIGMTLVAVTVLWGEDILTALYGSGYAAHQPLLVLLALGSAVMYAQVFVGTGVTAMRDFRSQWPVSAAGAAAVLALSAVLVPAMGMSGAALAVLGGAIVQATLSVLVLIPLLRRRSRCTVS